MNHEPTSYTIGHCQVYYPMAAQLRHPQPEQLGGSQSLGGDEAQEGSRGRITVRITRHGVRLLDPDNLSGAKPLIDQLRYSGLLPEDNPEVIFLQLHQVKAPKDKIGTLIEIIYP